MARWRLRTPHYLNVTEPWEWEYKQVNRKNGREDRLRLRVPRFLDIKDPADWTMKPDGLATSKGGNFDEVDGLIIVCWEGKGEPNDVEIVSGQVTPEMDPIDDEARAISASMEDAWRYKPEGAEISHSQSMIERFDIEMAQIRDKAQIPQQLVIPGLEDLVKQMAALTINQNAMLEKLAAKPVSRLG